MTDKTTPPMTAADLVAQGVDPQVASDWLKIRKDKGAKSLTITAWKGLLREATAAGMTAGQAVEYAAEHEWWGFRAAWVQRGAQLAGKPAFKTVRERDNEARRAKINQLTLGRLGGTEDLRPAIEIMEEENHVRRIAH